MRTYRVVAPAAYFNRVTAGGLVWTLFYRDAVLPSDAAVDDVARLVADGMVADEDEPEPVVDPPPIEGVSAEALQAAVAEVRSTAVTAASDASAAMAATQSLTVEASGYRSAVAESRQDRLALHARDAELARSLADLETLLRQSVNGLALQLDAIELTPGPAGPAGRDGVDGQRGADGADGAKGETGPPGTPADPARLAALEASVTALLLGQPKLSTGSATTPALSLGGTAVVTVPITPAMADTTYTPVVSLLAGASVLGNMQIQGVTAKAAGSVSVRLAAPLLAVSAGAATVQVVALKLP